MSKIEIRYANAKDVDVIYGLENLFGDEGYSRELILSSLVDENMYNVLIFVDEAVKGYLTASRVFDESELMKIIITEDARRCGLASMLMDLYLKDMQKMGVLNLYLEVRSNNIPAKKLYEKFNYNKIYQREKYYSDGVDADIYWYKVDVKD
jgi:ribosomal protein S18 acetylase RimI-like enzyme